MFDFLLLFLFALNHVDFNLSTYNQAISEKNLVIENLLDNNRIKIYHLENDLPPIKKSLSVSPSINITAKSAIVLDEKSGKILWQKNPNEVSSIASLTKLMTATIFLETKPDFEKDYEITKEDNEGVIGSILQVKQGDKLKVKDLFYSSLVGSINNTTKAMVHSTGISEEDFVKMMNERAQKFGLKDTKFTDVTGLDPGNESTPQEYIKIANYAFHNSKIKEAVNLPEYTFETIDKKIKHVIKNTDKLLTISELNLVGAKTGYLDEAGYTFVCEANKSGKEIMVVLFGSQSSESRFKEAEALINWAYESYIWL